MRPNILSIPNTRSPPDTASRVTATRSPDTGTNPNNHTATGTNPGSLRVSVTHPKVSRLLVTHPRASRLPSRAARASGG